MADHYLPDYRITGLPDYPIYTLSSRYISFFALSVRKLGQAIRRPVYAHLVTREINKTGIFPPCLSCYLYTCLERYHSPAFAKLVTPTFQLEHNGYV